MAASMPGSGWPPEPGLAYWAPGGGAGEARSAPGGGWARRPGVGVGAPGGGGHRDPAGLGLPPGADDRAAPAADDLPVPQPRLGVDGLAHRAQQAQLGQVVALGV